MPHPSLASLWGRLHAREALGLEVEAGGYQVGDWFRALALGKLVPNELEAEMVGRPDLRQYCPALEFVWHRLGHYRATSQAAAVSKNPKRRAGRGLGDCSRAQPCGVQPDPRAASQDWTAPQQAWTTQQAW